MSPKMVELHDIDVPAFLKVLDSCEGEVYLMTRDGADYRPNDCCRADQSSPSPQQSGKCPWGVGRASRWCGSSRGSLTRVRCP